nr:MAG TPA: 50S ribosomal protein L2 [Caudoviricetes sp.]
MLHSPLYRMQITRICYNTCIGGNIWKHYFIQECPKKIK